MTSIPVVILSGFLGSGKTTLLLRLMRDAAGRGLRPGVLMNELGKQDIDGRLLEAELPDSRVEKLFDGCICCDKKSEIAGCLLRLLDQRPDVILIELTGVANPEEIAESLTDPLLLRCAHLRHIVTVLDAEHALDYNSIFSTDRQLVDTLRRQMEAADVILINKVDLVTPATLEKIKKAVRKSNPDANLVQTCYSEINTGILLDGLQPIAHADSGSPRVRFLVHAAHPDAEHQHHEHRHEHAHEADPSRRSYSRLQTIALACAPGRLLPEKQIERFLKQIDGQLLRAKGYVATDSRKTPSLLQFAGKRLQWSPVSYSGAGYLVLIGIGLNEQAIREQWTRLGQ